MQKRIFATSPVFIHTDWNRLAIQQKLQAVPFELEYELLSVEFSKVLTSTPKILTCKKS
jgi:hypothetical protein